jgi:hypothetical protein
VVMWFETVLGSPADGDLAALVEQRPEVFRPELAKARFFVRCLLRSTGETAATLDPGLHLLARALFAQARRPQI